MRPTFRCTSVFPRNQRRCAALLASAAAWLVSVGAGQRPGVDPVTPWSCPDTHPIKGYVSAESGARVYHVPGGAFYEEASPERCYATDEEAQRDGSRPANDWRPPLGIADDRSQPKCIEVKV
jgi:hypothetical protein